MLDTDLANPTGTQQFEVETQQARQGVLDSIPASLRLPRFLLDDLPDDVTDIPDSCGLLSRSDLDITSKDATAIRDAIASGQLNAVAAVTAFGKRAAIAHQLVNCLTDFFLDDAVERAVELDAIFARTGKLVGPLHGVPISLKAHITVQSTWRTSGFKAFLEIVKEDCALVKVLRKLGAVPFVKTNMPQAALSMETFSLFGRTLNPFNLMLTAGGSSGGESALIALKGSCLGIGSDGGGSIRGPAAHCGIHGFRPTSDLLPFDGNQWCNPGSHACTASLGPLCASARDIDLFMSIVNADAWDLLEAYKKPIYWHPQVFWTSKLKIGVMRCDGVVLAQPPMLRGFDAVVEKLRTSDQVEVVEFEPYKQREILDVCRSLFIEDGGDSIRRLMKEGGEDLLPLTKWFLDAAPTQRFSIESLWAAMARRDQLRAEYVAHWRKTGIDVLLCPPFPGTACTHDNSRYWGYTAVYNSLDFPGMVFPIGLKADPALDAKIDRHDFIPDHESADEFNHKIYDAEVYKGAPISLQLLALPYYDPYLYEALKVVEGIWRS